MKFSIRDLLLVTVIVALAVGWWVTRVELKQQREAARQWRILYERIPRYIRTDDTLIIPKHPPQFPPKD